MAGAGLESPTTAWAKLYQDLVRALGRLAVTPEVDASALQTELRRILAEQRERRPRSRADRIRARLMEGVRPVRSLLRALVALPWSGFES